MKTFNLKPTPTTILCDYYKISHVDQYPKGTTKIVSSWTPRKSRIEGVNEVVVFGQQAFVMKYLIHYYQENFFKLDIEQAIADYSRMIHHTLGVDDVKIQHIRDLHALQYLPLKIKSLKEGTTVPLRVPTLTIENTDERFFWLPGFLESLMSSELWQPSTSATISRKYNEIVSKYAEETCDSNAHIPYQMHDFSFRGMAGLEAAAASGAGHLLSFSGTDSIPSIHYLETFYDADIEKELVGTSIPATEHSVMCLNASKDLDEYDSFKNLLTNVYPSGIFSAVADSYDFWNVVTDTLPKLYDEIMSRDGKFTVRPDCYDEETQILTDSGWKYFKNLTNQDLVAQVLDDETYEFVKPLKYVNEYYKGEMIRIKDYHGKVNLLVTPNHRMIIQQTNNKTKETKERIIFAGELKEKGNHNQKMLRSAKAKNFNKELTNIERLKIAFQADGSYTSKGKKIRFSFSKERKMNRLEYICSKAGVSFNKYNLSDGKVEYHLNVDSTEFKKDFNWVNTINLDGNWCVDFIEELSYWDSTRRSEDRFKFDTTNKEVSDIVELIALSAGYGDLISVFEDNRKEHFSTVYTHNILKENFVGGQSWKKTSEQYEGQVYCVQVPTGRLLVKRGRGTLVCGNSGDPVKIICGDPEAEELHVRKGLIECLYDVFGGTVNAKGYVELDSHIGAIYGDSITLERAEQICKLLKEKGFASNNIVFGVGSFSFQYQTRDSLGYAMKATYAKVDGQERLIFKDPKTDDGTKRSQRGLIHVYKDEEGLIKMQDGLNQKDYDEFFILNPSYENLMEDLFVDGELVRFETLEDIKATLAAN